MSKMRAKFQINTIIPCFDGCETLIMSAVCGKPFDENGISEDNTYAKYCPAGSMSLTVNNPALAGAFKVGEKYYLDFTIANE
jgi:hypothetical protein